MRPPTNARGPSHIERTLVALAFVGAALLPAVAQARPDFPPDMARHLSAAVAPACSVCHLEGKTGGITVVTPFAMSLRAHGFTNSSETLLAALDQMAADGTDTDGDGVSDVNELRAGTDPNSPVPGAATADPTYGCAVASRPGGNRETPLLIVALALALLIRRRATGRGRRPTLAVGRGVNAGAARPSSVCLRERP